MIWNGLPRELEFCLNSGEKILESHNINTISTRAMLFSTSNSHSGTFALLRVVYVIVLPIIRLVYGPV
jgi:hypothetical protein